MNMKSLNMHSLMPWEFNSACHAAAAAADILSTCVGPYDTIWENLPLERKLN